MKDNLERANYATRHENWEAATAMALIAIAEELRTANQAAAAKTFGDAVITSLGL